MYYYLDIVIYIVFSVIIIVTSWIITDDIINRYNINEKPLYDNGHVYLPDLSKHYQLVDWVLVTNVLLVILLHINNPLICTFFMMCATLVCLKYIIQVLTILPDPTVNSECQDRYTNIFWKFLFGNCNDMMFSGHTALSTLSTIFLIKKLNTYNISYTSKGFLKCLFILMTVFVAFMSIAARNHYTIDVVMALFVVYFVWHEGNKWFDYSK